MLTRRRIILQLTPLLDLLLIVIFAQYLEVRQSAAEQQQSVEESQRQSEQTEHELRRTADELQTELAASRVQLEIAREQTRRLTELGLEQLQIPREKMNAMMRDLVERLSDDGSPSRPPDVEEPLDDEVTPDAEATALQQRRLLQFLQTYVELRKRSDVWELYLAESGVVTLIAGDAEQTFRATDDEGFAQRLFDAYKKLPQPKGLVVILLSFGDTRADDRQIAIRGLELATRRMQEDRGDQTRFEFSVLGYQPQKPQRPVP